ncbi:Conserved hypothetical protein CHP02464 [Penicillium canescens]|nr:Conserved hypothetical protein CHP02464 [Penicillium canescens]KAJ6084833.1 Conserved hypothetical protein CHP02464 [Penicillium canescens]KAJ6161618.1 Conserved hypothetical protein CHP02464 [Penicillium canescens]
MLLNFKKSQDGRASLPTELNPTCEHEDETVSVAHQEHQDRGGREERHGLLQEGQRGIRRVQPVAQVRLRVREPDVHDTKQYMMYKKAEMFDDTEVMRETINTPDDHPQRAQENGKDGQELQRARMAPQNRDLMKMLLDASDKELVEASPYDRIWGIGFDKAHAAADVTNWGSNKLERSLLEVRAMINDMLRLTPNGMTGSIPVTTTTLAFCDLCITENNHMIMNTLVEGSIYMATLRRAIMEYAGYNDKLTTVVCVGCEVNYTPAFEQINRIEHCSSRKKWRFAYLFGGDLFVYMTCYTCAEENPERVMNRDQVFESYVEACRAGQEMTDTSPELNQYLYNQQVVIWGAASNLAAIL